MSERLSGLVKWYNSKRGYGFIQREDGGDEDVFIHASAIKAAGHRFLKENQKLTFELKQEEGQKGPSAVNIELKE
tara:strand:+ start:613 stop:837 length:225 start_codon:yes stop_codon:yes gene_type:complete